jgi:type I restriction enzyme, S subunit
MTNRPVTLGELAACNELILSDGYRTRADQLGLEGFPILRVADVLDGRLAPSFKDHIRIEYRSKMGTKISRPGDVLITTKGTVGRVAHVPEGFPEHSYSPQVCFLRSVEAEVIDPSWLFHWARSPELLEQLGLVKDQTDMAPYVSLTDLRQVQISIPPVAEQRRIASVLGALDDLIETSRRTAAAALDLAVASFSQLVAHSPGAVKLSDVTTKIGSGATPRGGKDVYQEAGVAFIRSQNVYDGQFAFDGLARITDAAADALRGVAVLSGDVLVNITGESVTRTALVPDRALPARVSQHVAIVRPDAEVLDSRFLMLALLSAPTKAHLNGLSSAGATRRALTKAHLAETKIPLPPLAAQQRVAQVLDTIDELGDEMADVTKARDELLPLLMSGKVRVSEALAVA